MAIVCYVIAFGIFLLDAGGADPFGAGEDVTHALGLAFVALGLAIGGVPIPALRPRARD